MSAPPFTPETLARCREAGACGGRAKGDRKRRGGSEYYRRLQAAAVAAKMAKAAAQQGQGTDLAAK